MPSKLQPNRNYATKLGYDRDLMNSHRLRQPRQFPHVNPPDTRCHGNVLAQKVLTEFELMSMAKQPMHINNLNHPSSLENIKITTECNEPIEF